MLAARLFDVPKPATPLDAAGLEPGPPLEAPKPAMPVDVAELEPLLVTPKDKPVDAARLDPGAA